MNYNFLYLNSSSSKPIVSYLLVLGLVLILSSCGKVYDQNGFDWEPDLPLSDTVFNREIQILDLGDANVLNAHKPIDKEDPLYFSLEKINSVHIGYRTTGRWDIAFHGGSRVNLSANNGSVSGIGYGSNAVGGLLVLDSAYSEVTTVPDDSRFITPGMSGLTGFGEEITPGGYAFYTFFDNMFRRDKVLNLDSPDPKAFAEANSYMHMIYCLSEDFSKSFPDEYGSIKYKPVPKTIIIRTASGNYAKLEMQSLYKGTMNPMEMRRAPDKPLPYASFRYMVIKKEEKRFGFVARNKKLTVNLTARTRTVEN